MANVEYRIQLVSLRTGVNIIGAGGTCHVATNGSPDKATLYDKTGAALANPITPTRGFLNFFVADTVSLVDLYVMTGGGHFVELPSVAPSGNNDLYVDTDRRRGTMKIPFSIADSVAATEKDTGFDMPAQAAFLDRLHGCGILVTTLESGKTIDVGTGEVHPAETGGDANGLIAASSLTTAVMVTGTNGALFSTNAPYNSDANAAKSITYTLSSASVAAKGFIILPYQIAG